MNNEQNHKTNIISENKGRGLFYGVIAIATFIIMAVGATFAYFTATTQSMNSALQTGSTTLKLEYISYGSAWMKNDLIPANTEIVQYSVENQDDTTPSNLDIHTGKYIDEDGQYIKNFNNTMCKDDYGNSICSIYVFQVKNSAQSPQSVSLNIVSEINGFSSLNAMAYELAIPEEREAYDSEENGNSINDPIFKESEDDEEPNAIIVTDGAGLPLYTYTPIFLNRNGVTKTLLQYIVSTDPGTGATTKASALDRALVPITDMNRNSETADRTTKVADDITISGGETKTFALVLYIKNEEYDQTDTDAAKSFEGQVIVSSGDGKTGVSGYISAAVNKDETEPGPEATE